MAERPMPERQTGGQSLTPKSPALLSSPDFQDAAAASSAGELRRPLLVGGFQTDCQLIAGDLVDRLVDLALVLPIPHHDIELLGADRRVEAISAVLAERAILEMIV